MEFLNPTLISPTLSRLSFSHNFDEAPQGTKMWPISGCAFNAQHVRFLSVFLCACAAMSYFMQSLWYQNCEDKIFKGIQMSWQTKYPARCRSWWMFDDFCLTLLPGLEKSRQHWGVWCDYSGSPAATTLAFLEPGKHSFNRTTLDTFHGYHLLCSSSSAHFFYQHTELNGFTLAKVFLKSFFSSVNDYCLCKSWRVALSYMQKWSKRSDIYTCLHVHLWQPCESLAQCCQSNPAKSAKLRVARHPLGFTSVAQWGLTSLTSWPCFLSWKQICQYVTVNFSDCRSTAISNPDASFPVVREQSYTSCTREPCSSWTVQMILIYFKWLWCIKLTI